MIDDHVPEQQRLDRRGISAARFVNYRSQLLRGPKPDEFRVLTATRETPVRRRGRATSQTGR